MDDKFGVGAGEPDRSERSQQPTNLKVKWYTAFGQIGFQRIINFFTFARTSKQEKSKKKVEAIANFVITKLASDKLNEQKKGLAFLQNLKPEEVEQINLTLIDKILTNNIGVAADRIGVLFEKVVLTEASPELINNYKQIKDLVHPYLETRLNIKNLLFGQRQDYEKLEDLEDELEDELEEAAGYAEFDTDEETEIGKEDMQVESSLERQYLGFHDYEINEQVEEFSNNISNLGTIDERCTEFITDDLKFIFQNQDLPSESIKLISSSIHNVFEGRTLLEAAELFKSFSFKNQLKILERFEEQLYNKNFVRQFVNIFDDSLTQTQRPIVKDYLKEHLPLRNDREGSFLQAYKRKILGEP